MKKLKLTIELIPSSSWNNNLRSLLKPKMWSDIKKSVYKKYNYRCAICDSNKQLHAHEIWEYDNENHIQKLINIVSLCSKCHALKHIGFSGIQASKQGISFENQVMHFMKVNNCTREVFEKHYKNAFKKFEERSHYDWQIDLSEYQKALK